MKDKRNNLSINLAYVAGFIDGEGCIRIKKSNQSGNSYYITVQVTNSDTNPLYKIQELFGGKVYYQERGKNKIIWQYYITCAEACGLLRTLTGFFISKKPQAELAIHFHENKDKMNPQEKLECHDRMRDLKINIHENPKLIK